MRAVRNMLIAAMSAGIMAACLWGAGVFSSRPMWEARVADIADPSPRAPQDRTGSSAENEAEPPRLTAPIPHEEPPDDLAASPGAAQSVALWWGSDKLIALFAEEGPAIVMGCPASGDFGGKALVRVREAPNANLTALSSGQSVSWKADAEGNVGGKQAVEIIGAFQKWRVAARPFALKVNDQFYGYDVGGWLMNESVDADQPALGSPEARVRLEERLTEFFASLDGCLSETKLEEIRRHQNAR